MARSVPGSLPTGGTLADGVFRRRHRTLRIVLGLHVPALALLAYLRAESALHLEIALAPVLLATLLSGFGSRRGRALAVSVGLACCSAAVIGLSGGAAESHYHVLIMVGFVALYQDWPPFLGFVVLTAVGYATAAALEPNVLFAQPLSGRAYLWASVHVAFVVAEAMAMTVFWRATEVEQHRATELGARMARSELDRTRAQDEQDRASVDLLSSLARRNQNLLDRQLVRIDALEQVERDPESLAELFSLDHLATRMRRNAESLLVLAGSAGTHTFETSVPLSEICRGAMAEVEDYARVDVALITDVLVNGPVVSDLVHLVAELIENATSFSPPNTRVTVTGNITSSMGYVLAVTDSGIGMADAELAAANVTLGDADVAPADVGAAGGTGLGGNGMLGLRVVARLAARYGVRAWLQRGQSSGLAAMLALPADALDATSPNLGPVPLGPMDGLFAASAPPTPLVTSVPSVVANPLPPVQPLPAATVTASGLPKRVPNASLAAPLADGVPAAGSGNASVTHTPIAPERARRLLAAYAGGVQRARQQAQESEVLIPAQGPAGGEGSR